MTPDINEENRIIGLRVKEERKRLKLTQAQIATECYLSRGQWVRYEKGEQGFSRKSLALFKALGADADYILTGKRSQLEQGSTQMNTDIMLLIENKKLDLRSHDEFVAFREMLGFLDALVKLRHISPEQAYQEILNFNEVAK